MERINIVQQFQGMMTLWVQKTRYGCSGEQPFSCILQHEQELRLAIWPKTHELELTLIKLISLAKLARPTFAQFLSEHPPIHRQP